MRRRIPPLDLDIDLVPLIDCIFLLLLFFLLCGRLIDGTRDEQVTVPPATTAHTVIPTLGWQRTTINLRGDAQNPVVVMGGREMTGPAAAVWPRLRAELDRLYDDAERYLDHRSPLGYAPKVVVTLRAHRDADWRTVQACQQLLADGLDPVTGRARSGTPRPFTHLEFAANEP